MLLAVEMEGEEDVRLRSPLVGNGQSPDGNTGEILLACSLRGPVAWAQEECPKMKYSQKSQT